MPAVACEQHTPTTTSQMLFLKTLPRSVLLKPPRCMHGLGASILCPKEGQVQASWKSTFSAWDQGPLSPGAGT